MHVFRTTYCGAQFFFSKHAITMNQLYSRLTDANLEKQLEVATSSIPGNMTFLTKKKAVPAVTLGVS